MTVAIFMKVEGASGESKDAAHKDWTEATCNSIKNATGADCRVNTLPDFAQFNKFIDTKNWNGMARSGWLKPAPGSRSG